MTYASFEDLTSRKVREEEIELPGLGTVLVRGISRYEYMLATKQSSDGDNQIDLPRFEMNIVKMGLVEPKLTVQQVEAWQKSPGAFSDFQVVHERIMTLSGLREGADKSNVQPVGDES